jgi:hypothetical protein
VIPDSGGADEICTFTKRGQREFGLVERNQRAALTNDVFDPAEKQRNAFHYAASEHDGVGAEHRDEIRYAKAEIVSLAIDRLFSEIFTGHRQFTDSFR